jgi:hypothetical protein
MPSVDDGYGNAGTSRGGSTSGPKSRGGRQRQQRQQQQNNNQNQGQGDGRAAAQAAHAARLNAAEAQRVATAKNAATLNEIESQRVAEQKAENQRAAEKAASKAKNKEDIVSARDRRDYVPVGSAWSDGPPSVRSRDPLERLERSSGRGMQGQGDAYYPTDFAESLEDNMPTGFSRGLFGSPMAAAASTVGKTFYNQHQYGMNKEAADLYKDLIADPANEGKTVKELVQMARKPQTDKYRAVEENKLNEMHKRGLIKDSNMSDTQWNSLPIEMKKHLTRDVNRNNLNVAFATQGDGGGGLIAGGIDPVEEEESTYTNLDSYLKLFGNNTY